jgi:hypothetical protein
MPNLGHVFLKSQSVQDPHCIRGQVDASRVFSDFRFFFKNQTLRREVVSALEDHVQIYGCTTGQSAREYTP